jgi:hypothetical protein
MRVASSVALPYQHKLGPFPYSDLIEAIKKVVVRALFLAATSIFLVGLLPLSFHAVILPLSVVGLALLTSFFYLSTHQQVGRVLSGKKPLPPLPEGVWGFPNLGATCWFSSMCHVIRRDPTVLAWLQSEIPSEDEQTERVRLAFRALFDRGRSDRALTRDAIQEMGWGGHLGHVQDASEPLVQLLQAIPELGIEVHTQGVLEDGSIIALTPEGGPPVLHLPITGPNPNLQEMVYQYLDEELPEPQWLESRGVFIHRKQIVYGQAPASCWVHVVRFSNDPNIEKVTTPMQAPHEVRLPATQGEGLYTVDSFVIHHGNRMEGGHYVACVKERLEDGTFQWYQYSDDARPMLLTEDGAYELMSHAYLMHWTRIVV